ncbi:hypothetical protein EVAR_75315_1 [Eumeta japonica]|uniref:Uncharacterized protein n=1 Tax=Eumeta variegata TaxID=151549 RepID=A0A4C1XXK6_EUMVA|nr:hypothetical protein EVAR_75315_1 [Eumeta japonica]
MMAVVQERKMWFRTPSSRLHSHTEKFLMRSFAGCIGVEQIEEHLQGQRLEDDEAVVAAVHELFSAQVEEFFKKII